MLWTIEMSQLLKGRVTWECSPTTVEVCMYIHFQLQSLPYCCAGRKKKTKKKRKRKKSNKRLLYSRRSECNYKHWDPVKASYVSRIASFTGALDATSGPAGVSRAAQQSSTTRKIAWKENQTSCSARCRRRRRRRRSFPCFDLRGSFSEEINAEEQ